jgi:hypothetical protein
MEGLIGDIPWCIDYCSEKFGLISLDDSYNIKIKLLFFRHFKEWCGLISDVSYSKYCHASECTRSCQFFNVLSFSDTLDFNLLEITVVLGLFFLYYPPICLSIPCSVTF